MIALLRAEVKRLFARRMTLFFPATLMALIVGGVVIAYFVIENDENSSGVDFVADITGGIDASSLFEPIAFLIPLMAFVVGASSIGADIKTGVVEQILTWEPRRLRFLVARCVAGFVGATVASIVVAATYVVSTFVLAAVTGTTDGATGELWSNIVVALLRLGVAGGLFCIFGVGVALLINNSVGAIVGFVVYFFIIENLVGVFLPRAAVYLPLTNTTAFAAGIDVQRAEGNVFSGDFELITSHGWPTAGLIVAVWTTLAAVGAGALFRSRDIA